MKDVENQCNNYKTLLNEKEDYIKSADLKLSLKDDIVKENNELKTEIYNLNKSKTQLLQEMDFLKEDLTKDKILKVENDKMKSEILNLENQQSLLKNERAKCEKELMKKTNELRTIINENNLHKGDLNDQRDKNKQLKKQISENLAEIDFLKLKLKEKDIILIEKEKENDNNSRRKYDNAIYENENKNREISYLKQTNEELKLEREALLKSSNEKDKIICDHENEIMKLRNGDEDSDSRINQLNDKISDVIKFH